MIAMMTRRVLAAALAGTLLIGAGAVQAADARAELAPPPTPQSQIWADPALPGTSDAAELAAKGYVREEYFQRGVANVYGYGADGKVRVERSAVPYVTRVVVVRPADQRRFSGTVHLNPMHPVQGGTSWSSAKDYVVGNGDAYVMVMIGADDNTRRAPPSEVPMMATKVLGWFNPERYSAIRWPDDEDGIRWDVFADTARLVKTPGALLGPLKATHTYANGWSYTGSFLRTFINAGFHDGARLPDRKPLIDGYVIGISSFTFISGYVPINTRSQNLPDTDPRRANLAIDVPVIELQSENEAVTNRDPQTPDKDRGPGAHRLYEVPGLTHGGGRRGGGNQQAQIAQRTGQAAAPRRESCPIPQTDIDMADYAQAAYANLDRWVRTGTPAPRAARLKQTAGVSLKDANGNTLGGIRPAQLEVPLASYGPAPAASGCDVQQGPRLGSAMMPMRRVPLPAERLKALYPGGQAEYLRRFDAAVDRLVRERWILAADGARQKREARVAAAAAF